ncbi:MAG: hypothetical protein ACD_2C00151G0003 [uncultured bacterium (gcode 4)]|uniref:N-acetyltransferase domain-containing protein n=1 Tax=uncultured bacterium (gcode 4) TaxID=1234023 RepID=K2G2W7_9BACT|nr:MAG: hypothetical protein ACD_2C00151G0003 [uncultured bacterium (gcode 4)]
MLKIRKHLRSDIPYRVKWMNNQNVNKYIWDDSNKKTTKAEQEKWFDAYIKVKNKIFFTICDDENPIWFMWLSNISKVNRNADLFIAIWDDDYRWIWYWEKAFAWLVGYGFGKLQLNKLNLWVYCENITAIKLYRKLGFEIEWTLREEVFFGWRFHDTHSMALFREKYLNKANLAW